MHTSISSILFSSKILNCASRSRYPEGFGGVGGGTRAKAVAVAGAGVGGASAMLTKPGFCALTIKIWGHCAFKG